MGTELCASAPFISIDDAICRVAALLAARNGDEWFGPLTIRQERIIAYYVTGLSSKPGSASIMPAMVTYSVAGQGWTRFSSDPALMAEIERALYQRDLYEEQSNAALDWLDGHGFNIDAQVISAEALARETAQDFTSTVVSSALRLITLPPVIGERTKSRPAAPTRQGKKSRRVQSALMDAGLHPDRKGKSFGKLSNIVICKIGGHKSTKQKAALKTMIKRLYSPKTNKHGTGAS